MIQRLACAIDPECAPLRMRVTQRLICLSCDFKTLVELSHVLPRGKSAKIVAEWLSCAHMNDARAPPLHPDFLRPAWFSRLTRIDALSVPLLPSAQLPFISHAISTMSDDHKTDLQEKPTSLVPRQQDDTESLRSEMYTQAKREGVKPAFLAKVHLINEAIAETGMGRYQWELFFTSGFGWMADNLCESISPAHGP